MSKIVRFSSILKRRRALGGKSSRYREKNLPGAKIFVRDREIFEITSVQDKVRKMT